VIQWLFFLWVVRWVAAIFGALAAAVAILLFLIAVVTEIRDVLL
jgi:hypothetical protein